jgi:hypothetical protein
VYRSRKLRIVDCGSSINALSIDDRRLTDCRLRIVDCGLEIVWRTSIDNRHQSAIINPSIANRQCVNRRSAIGNPLIDNPQSTIRN